MKKTLTTLALTAVIAFVVSPAAAQGFGPGDGTGDDCTFIDENGDGFNDFAPDADGDGIPNRFDEDYVKPEDGSGAQHKKGQDLAEPKGNANAWRHGQQLGPDAEIAAFGEDCDGTGEPMGDPQGNRHGLADGTGTGIGPADGTGFGPGTGAGTEDCDGTGEPAGEPKGNRNGRR